MKQYATNVVVFSKLSSQNQIDTIQIQENFRKHISVVGTSRFAVL